MRVDKQIAIIRRWLLTSHLQLSGGPERGGIAGWLNDRNRPEFVYGEATGYYMTAMAFMHALTRGGDVTAIQKARRAFAWVHRWCEQGQTPPTRRYLQNRNGDWRCHAQFAFDLAMMLRGVAAMQGLVPQRAWERTRAGLVNALRPFCSPDAGLMPFLPQRGIEPMAIPEKWSTKPGPYQVKIAGSVAMSLNSETPDDLVQACRRVYSRFSRGPECRVLTGQWHADAYFIEGLILMGVRSPDVRAWRLAGENYRTLADHFTGADRSDVVAQLLRAGSVLRSRGLLPEPFWQDRLNAFADLLLKFVDEERAVSFRLDGAHWNSWCALFAYQSLHFYRAVCAGSRIDDRWIELLV